MIAGSRGRGGGDFRKVFAGGVLNFYFGCGGIYIVGGVREGGHVILK